MHCNTSRAEYDVASRQFMIGEFVFDVGSLYAHLEQLPDRRDPRGVRYSLVDALTLIILAKLGGEDSVLGIAEWLKHHAEELVQALKVAAREYAARGDDQPHLGARGGGRRTREDLASFVCTTQSGQSHGVGSD